MQLEVHKELVGELQKLGIEFSTEDELLTQPLTVIYESDDAIYVFVPLIESGPQLPPADSALPPFGQVANSRSIEITVSSRVIRLDKKTLSASIVSGINNTRMTGHI